MRFFLFIFTLAICSKSFAVTDKDEFILTEEDYTARMSLIKKWKNFDGVWEGKIKYVSAPKSEWMTLEQAIKIIMDGKNAKVFLKYENSNEWQEAGNTYYGWGPDPLTVIIEAYRSKGVWTEHHIVTLTRDNENTGHVFLQRVVNNWAGKPKKDETLIYGDSRVGYVTRLNQSQKND